jgi:Cys-rich repeat protein
MTTTTTISFPTCPSSATYGSTCGSCTGGGLCLFDVSSTSNTPNCSTSVCYCFQNNSAPPQCGSDSSCPSGEKCAIIFTGSQCALPCP